MKNKNKILIMILSTVFTVILSISLTYAFFYYGKEGSTITLEAGSISLRLEEDANFLTLHDTYPKSDNIGMINTKYYDFTVVGSKGKDDDILYEIQIEQMEDNTLAEEYVKVYLTDQEDMGLSNNSLINFPTSEYTKNRVIYTDYIYSENQEDDYRLRIWVDEKYTKNVQETFNFKLILYAINDEFKSLYDIVEESLASYLTEPDGEEDYDARFVSGSKSDANLKNYVWYSGKLWRIVALNNNGTIKMVTAEEQTAISWGEDSVFYEKDDTTNVEKKSWVYQWLNEDFLNTLYNYKNILVTDYLWNATRGYETTKPPKTTMVSSPVGLLNTYEYSTITKLFMNIKNRMLLNSYDDTNIYCSDRNGNLTYKQSNNNGNINPVVILQTIMKIRCNDCDGSASKPYTLVGDVLQTAHEKLNKRVAGEYIRFDNQLYRISAIEDQKVKLVKYDYIRDSDNKIIKKYLSRSNSLYSYFDYSSSLDDWNLYLNNIWYGQINNFPTRYKDMLVKADWYLGNYTLGSYKDTICEDINTEKTIRECKKTDSKFNCYIGLGRIGELFANQHAGGTDNWILSPYIGGQVSGFWADGNFYYNGGSWFQRGVYPSFYLSPDVYITGGLGTKESPFEIAI